MSEQNKTQTELKTESYADDPFAQALDAPPPEDKKETKGLPKIVKIGAVVMSVGMLFLVALQMAQPEPQPSQQVDGKIGVRVNEAGGFVNTPATAISTNPEAQNLNQQVQEQRAQEILSRPGTSFVTADPFGNPTVGVNPFESAPQNDQVAPLMPPPPPPELVAPQPVQPQGAQGEQVDPSIAFAQTIFSAAVATRIPGVSPGNYTPSEVNDPTGSATGVSTGSANAAQVATMGAGEIVYAQLTSLLNSIVPQTPPRAIIRGGVLNGAILLGQMEVVENKYLVLRFTTLTLNKKTYPISAMAVNTEMLDAGLVDKVNNRVWTRAALQAGVGFVQAFGAAKLEEGTTSNVTAEGVTSTSVPKRTNKETAVIALGGAAQSLQPTVEQQINNIKDEVIAFPGKEIGIVFMQPFFMN